MPQRAPAAKVSSELGEFYSSDSSRSEAPWRQNGGERESSRCTRRWKRFCISAAGLQERVTDVPCDLHLSLVGTFSASCYTGKEGRSFRCLVPSLRGLETCKNVAERETHFLSTGAQQNHMGGPRTLPEPVSRRLRCLRICMVCGFLQGIYVEHCKTTERVLLPTEACRSCQKTGLLLKRAFAELIFYAKLRRLQSWILFFFFTSLFFFVAYVRGGMWVGINVVFVHISVAICVKSCLQLVSIKRGDHFCPTLYWNRGHNAQKCGFYLEVVGQRPWRGANQ